MWIIDIQSAPYKSVVESIVNADARLVNIMIIFDVELYIPLVVVLYH